MARISRGPVALAAGTWKTLETFWGSVGGTTAFFLLPTGVRIKVRYGLGWFGWDRQTQTLDGVNEKRLSVSGFVGRARMQARSATSTTLSYEIEFFGP